MSGAATEVSPARRHARGQSRFLADLELDAGHNALAAGVDAIEHCTFITATGIEVPNSVRRR